MQGRYNNITKRPTSILSIYIFAPSCLFFPIFPCKEQQFCCLLQLYINYTNKFPKSFTFYQLNNSDSPTLSYLSKCMKIVHVQYSQRSNKMLQIPKWHSSSPPRSMQVCPSHPSTTGIVIFLLLFLSLVWLKFFSFVFNYKQKFCRACRVGWTRCKTWMNHIETLKHLGIWQGGNLLVLETRAEKTMVPMLQVAACRTLWILASLASSHRQCVNLKNDLNLYLKRKAASIQSWPLKWRNLTPCTPIAGWI